MDPQSYAFTPQNEVWRLSNTMKGFQEVQQDHADRLSRIERRQEEETRVKSVWGPSSPFPSVLSGSLQTAPAKDSRGTEFTTFDDDHSNNMVRSLHLDADDEPRRLGAASRANSVRFDESANQAQMAHGSRTSFDMNSRTSSGLAGLGGHPMFERTSSHKSDGRHSSAGQSVMSGRANSLGLDTTNNLSQTPTDPPGLAPGLFILGTVPSIIRCWLNESFKHESLLYAAVCTGSYKSFLDLHLINELGFADRITQDINGDHRIKLPMYLPEAVPHPVSSRSSSPAPQLPSIDVDFAVVEHSDEQRHSKAIQVFIGSDTLRAHSAEISFCSNTLVLFDEDKSKLSIPLVRPENDAAFKSLYITSAIRGSRNDVKQLKANHQSVSQMSPQRQINGNLSLETQEEASKSHDDIGDERKINPDADDLRLEAAAASIKSPVQSHEPHRKASLAAINTSRPEAKDGTEMSPPSTASARTGPPSAISNNWRRDAVTSQSTQNDWANVSRGSSATYARPNRDAGSRVVLKPSRQLSRSSNPPASASPTASSQSRFFDDGKRRNGPGSMAAGSAPTSDSGDSSGNLRRSTSTEIGKPNAKDSKENSGPPGKGRGGNPIGGASAFGWLNTGQGK
ncbi:MAG: CSN-associated deubiquitinating enzyme Ubp12 [Alyxoria varia]|nr:MAG: CSN-associated deubiquitinating enzyme Ubp12 [Alyxoria varia]